MHARPTALLALATLAACQALAPDPVAPVTVAEGAPLPADATVDAARLGQAQPTERQAARSASQEQILVEVEIEQIAADGTVISVSAPRLLVLLGQDAELETGFGEEGGTVRVRVKTAENGELATRIPAARLGAGSIETPARVRNVGFRVPPSLSSAPSNAPTTTWRFENADVRDAVATIAGLARANVILPPQLAGNVDIAVDAVGWRTALELVVEPLGYRLEELRGGVLNVVPVRAASELRTIDLDLVTAEARWALGDVAERAGLVLAIDDDVTGTVTLAADGVPLQLALRALSESLGCEVVTYGDDSPLRIRRHAEEPAD